MRMVPSVPSVSAGWIAINWSKPRPRSGAASARASSRRAAHRRRAIDDGDGVADAVHLEDGEAGGHDAAFGTNGFKGGGGSETTENGGSRALRRLYMAEGGRKRKTERAARECGAITAPPATFVLS